MRRTAGKPKGKFGSSKLPAIALAGLALSSSSGFPGAPSRAVPPGQTNDTWRAPERWLEAAAWPFDAALWPFLFQRDHVLGTSFDLTVWAREPDEADRAEGVVLAEIDRLSRILSRYDSQSEINLLNADALTRAASPDLLALLRAYDTWTDRSGGALNAQLGSLIDLWKTAEATGMEPAAIQLASHVSKINSPAWRIDPETGRVRREGGLSLNVDCLGKGYIIQRAIEAARSSVPGVWGLMLNIGGDIAVRGNGTPLPGTPWLIHCADPLRPCDNASPLTSIRISDGAVATSAAYERGFTVAGRRYSHILDPRTGRPASGVASATVVARDSVTANALATALCVLSPSEGLAWLRAVDGAEALIVSSEGFVHRTAGFAALELPLALVALEPGAMNTEPALVPGGMVNIVTNDSVSFALGAAHIERPVQLNEKFRIVSVTGDQITIADDFGSEATLSRSVLKPVMPTQPHLSAAPVATPTPAKPAPGPAASPAARPGSVFSSASWPAGYQVTLNLELAAPPPQTQRVRRPYVAIWVEDAAGKPVRTVTVWGAAPKWLPSLTNWWGFAGAQPGLISNTTRATRDAGKYQVAWDGLDDAGKPVGRGTFTVVLEVRRQHGAHEIHRSTINCGDTSAQGKIPGATEFLDCPLAYGPPAT